MISVLLYGHLAKQFGKFHRFAVSTPGEAVRALAANYPGFEQALIAHKPGYHVFRGKENLGKKNLIEPSGKDAIRIVPVVAGAKRNGILQIIEGIVIIVAAVVYGVYTEDWASAANAIQYGSTLIFGGVITFLFSPPSPSKGPNTTGVNQPSYAFNGPVNTTAQGHPVPVGYGRLRVGSAVISGGIFVQQIDQAGGAIGGDSTSPVPLRVGGLITGSQQ